MSAVVFRYDDREPAPNRGQLADRRNVSCESRRQRVPRDLEGEQSPWEEQVIHRWKRRGITKDLSAEKSLEIEASFVAVLAVSSGNRCGGRRQGYEAYARRGCEGSPEQLEQRRDKLHRFSQTHFGGGGDRERENGVPSGAKGTQ